MPAVEEPHRVDCLMLWHNKKVKTTFTGKNITGIPAWSIVTNYNTLYVWETYGCKLYCDWYTSQVYSQWDTYLCNYIFWGVWKMSIGSNTAFLLQKHRYWIPSNQTSAQEVGHISCTVSYLKLFINKTIMHPLSYWAFSWHLLSRVLCCIFLQAQLHLGPCQSDIMVFCFWGFGIEPSIQ